MNPVAFGVCGIIFGLAASGVTGYVLWLNHRLRRRLAVTNLTVVALKRGKPDDFDRNIQHLLDGEA